MARIIDPPELWNAYWQNPSPQTQRGVAEHYIAVCYTICGDFGKKFRRHPKEFWGIAWEALYGRVPHWKLGDAPFANYAAVRIRGAIMDDVGAHGWKRHQGGEEVCREKDEGEIVDGFGRTEGNDGYSADERTEMSRLISRLTGECSPEARMVFAKVTLDRRTIQEVAEEMDRPASWVAARKREVAEVLAGKLSRESAGERIGIAPDDSEAAES